VANLKPPPPPQRLSGEYSYAAREQQVPIRTDPAPAGPTRSASPSPESGSAVHVQISEKGFDARVRGGKLSRFAPWIVPAVLSVLAPIGTGILGYYQGLKMAAARVAALELQVDAAKEILRQEEKDANRFAVVQRDHESRLITVEHQLKLEPPIVVKASP
jgi:hypothetical protein